MKLRGTFTLTIGGRALVARNAVTDAGLALAARALCGQGSLQGARLGLMFDGEITPGDTLASHPGWLAASPEVPVTLSPQGALLRSDVRTLRPSADGMIGGCYLAVGDVLFSTTTFEVQPVVAGDVVECDYTLDLERA